ncbi:DUF4215 domain-containing protein, partial [Myxococcota bacterium]|nr:DUF4215 domain-containing protein [Myxococcota bacterium]
MRTFILFTAILVLFAACDEKNTGGENCGDGVIDPGEECDGEDLGGDSCASLGYHGGQLLCDDQCQLNLSACETEGSCGDGIIQEGFEQCEDGVSTDTCNSLGYGQGVIACDGNCQWDYSDCTGASSCGNDIIEGSEECEGTNLNNKTCESFGYHGGTLNCTGLCMFDKTDCAGYGRCGDGLLQGDFEQCDNTNFGEKTCETEGYHGGTLSCDASCQLILSDCESVGSCGDGQIQNTYEQCDSTELGGESCASQGGYEGTLVCADDCTFDISGCIGFCGDNAIQEGYEECDTTELPETITCESLGHQYGGTLSCSSSCHLDSSACHGWCGDGIIQGSYGETCDGTNMAGVTCQSIGYSQGGNIESCHDDCTLDVSGCNQFVSLKTGYHHTCGLDLSGTAYCWGNNYSGQLGDGTTTNKSVPTQVVGGVSFESLFLGNSTCGLTSTGVAYCWGSNPDGQLGDGTTTNSSTPVPVAGGHSFESIKAGAYFTCGLAPGGVAYCWGSNSHGQLGDGTTINSSTPVPVAGGHSFESITLSSAHACGLAPGGVAYCWG